MKGATLKNLQVDFTSYFRVFSFIVYKSFDNMAESASRPYNLRSKDEVVELPVQLHLSDDNRFMSDLLASNRTHTGQVTDSESSINKSDCSPPSKPGCSSGHTVVNKKNGVRSDSI